MFFYLCQIIITLAGYAYPAYSSYKAVKTNDAAQLEVWLMYWVVIAFVSVAEMTVEWTISWIPFYWELKTLIVLWLTLPQIQGSTFVYVTFVHPFLTTHDQSSRIGVHPSCFPSTEGGHPACGTGRISGVHKQSSSTTAVRSTSRKCRGCLSLHSMVSCNSYQHLENLWTISHRCGFSSLSSDGYTDRASGGDCRSCWNVRKWKRECEIKL
ncbi:hypothetical protein BT69DRAFT_1087199 [Atractiella rhizophila]|nr:hypothetical protein BT69DRAFT_1087199 [Atractiella rhizophila]